MKKSEAKVLEIRRIILGLQKTPKSVESVKSLLSKRTRDMQFLYRQESYDIIGAAMEVHKTLGLGFTEYVYQDALEKEFQLRGIPYEREKHMTVSYKGAALQHDFYADFVCYGCIIVELKAVKELADEHRAQVINYLKVSGMKLGLLFNFGSTSLVHERLLN